MQEKIRKEIKYMATGRMTKKVLDHIANINKENKQKELSKNFLACLIDSGLIAI